MLNVDEQLERAREFARALLDLAGQPDQVEAVQADLDSLAELVRDNADLARLVDSPLINEPAKAASMGRIFAGAVGELTGRFLQILAAHNALPLLRVLGQAFAAERDARSGRVTVEATTATPLDESQRAAMTAKLTAVLAAPVILLERVDESVLGGLVLRIGDTLFDGSVRHGLEQLRRQVIARGYHEIQGRRDLIAD